MNSKPNIALIFLLLSANFGCGRSDQPKGSNSVVATDGNTPCTDESCPPINLSISASPMENGKLKGNIVEPNNWTISGTAQGGGKRDIRMKAYNPPVGGDFSGQNTLSILASYKSLEPMDSKAPIDAVIRDVSRCKHDLPQRKADCENLDFKGLDQFESRASFPWTIAMGDINQFADPSFTQAQTVPLGANAGISGCFGGFFQGAIGSLPQAMAGGGLLPAILKGGVGCLSNSVGNMAQ